MGWTIIFIVAAVLVIAAGFFYYKFNHRPKATELQLPYTQGLNALLAGDLERARERFQEAVRQDSNNLDAYLKLGAVLRQKGQVVQAVKVHQSLTVRADLKPAQKVEIYRELAQDYEEAEAYRRAAEAADQILALMENHYWALTFRIRIAERLQDWQTAFNLTRRLNSIEGEKDARKLALYRVEEGRDLIDTGKGKEGRVKCREAIKLDRACVAAYLTLAKSYVAEKREEDAVKELNRLLDANPEKCHLGFELLEEIYFNLGRFGEVEKLYRRMVNEHPENLDAAKALAQFLKKKGDVEGVLKVCQQALERHPDDLWIRRFMIRTLVETGRTSEIGPLVIEILDRVLEEAKRYVCRRCGFETSEPLWRCPRCSAVDSFDI